MLEPLAALPRSRPGRRVRGVALKHPAELANACVRTSDSCQRSTMIWKPWYALSPAHDKTNRKDNGRQFEASAFQSASSHKTAAEPLSYARSSKVPPTSHSTRCLLSRAMAASASQRQLS